MKEPLPVGWGLFLCSEGRSACAPWGRPLACPRLPSESCEGTRAQGWPPGHRRSRREAPLNVGQQLAPCRRSGPG